MTKPPVWRRIAVPAGLTLDLLHEVIQEAMGWEDGHMHVFSTPGRDYGVPDSDLGYADERRVTLAQVLARPGARMRYTYDFGDDADCAGSWCAARTAAFQALGEHMRDEMAALTRHWGLVARLREHVKEPPGRDRLASVRRASALYHPDAWAELAAFAEGSAIPVDDLVWTIDHLPVAAPGDGAGRHFVGRGLQRTARTLDAAVDYLKVHPSAGGFAYTIGDQSGRIVNVEAVAGNHAAVEGPDRSVAVAHQPRPVHPVRRAATGEPAWRAGRRGALPVPEQDPGPAWFLAVLAERRCRTGSAPTQTGVQRHHAVHGHRRPHRRRGRHRRPWPAAGHDPAPRPGRRPSAALIPDRAAGPPSRSSRRSSRISSSYLGRGEASRE